MMSVMGSTGSPTLDSSGGIRGSKKTAPRPTGKQQPDQQNATDQRRRSVQLPNIKNMNVF